MAKLQYRIGKKALRRSIYWAQTTWKTISNHTSWGENRVYVSLINGLGHTKSIELPVLDAGG